MSPVLDALANEYKNRVTFVKVDLDSNQGLAMRFQVQGVPHFQVWKNGQKVDEFSGADRNKLEYLVKLHSMDVEAPIVSFTCFPITSYALSELTTQIQPVLKKITELNANVDEKIKLNDDELAALLFLLEHLLAKDHAFEPSVPMYALLKKFALWPANARVPALDVIRCAFAHPAICEHFMPAFVSKVPEGDVITQCLDILHSETVTAIELRMLWRFVTNLLASDHLRESVCHTDTVQLILETMLKPNNNDQALRMYLCDALLNLTVALENLPNRNDETNYLLTKTLEVSIRLMTTETDENALCRLLVGLGTVVVRNPPFQMILCGNEHLKSFLQLKKSSCKVEHNVKAITELLTLLSKPL